MISINVSTLLGYIVYFTYSIFCVKKYSKKNSIANIFIAIISGMIILHLPTRIFSFKSSFLSLPDDIFHLLGTFSSYVWIKWKGFLKWLTVSIISLATLFMYVEGYDLWFYKLEYGTFTGKVILNPNVNLVGITESGTLLQNSDLRGKIILFDFWFTQCKACFEEFPELQKIYNKNRLNSKLKIFSINKPITQDTLNQSFNILRKKNYTFPNLILKSETIPDLYGLKSYPTTILLNENGEIIFRGDLTKAEKYIDELLNER